MIELLSCHYQDWRYRMLERDMRMVSSSKQARVEEIYLGMM